MVYSVELTYIHIMCTEKSTFKVIVCMQTNSLSQEYQNG